MILLDILIAGNVMIGPTLCKADLIYKDQLYTVEYKCHENGILPIGHLGTLSSRSV